MIDLLVDIDASANNAALLRYTFALAKRCGGHVTGVNIVRLDAALLALPDPLELIDQEERQAREREPWWMRQCEANGVSGEWEVYRGFYEHTMARRASLTDMVVGRLISAESKVMPRSWLLGRTLLAGSAPVILVPDGCLKERGAHTIVIAWNGSIEAARAVKAALPLLLQAKRVIVLDGETQESDTRPTALRLNAWLVRHGVVADWEALVFIDDPGHAILARALEHNADLLVMGAWSHSRAHEVILGGVTRHVLQHSRVPLLLSH
ncbi:MAG TPA: universal stress protein [Dyella sp.]|uniref:universal stress protein n=1 Tax=Dyella sp. TaxID=1869338 RepID=UPI002F94666D